MSPKGLCVKVCSLEWCYWEVVKTLGGEGSVGGLKVTEVCP
jgi:hypothetical protein